MRGSVVFLFVILVIVLFSFIAFSLKNEEIEKNNTGDLEFSTFTSAICENKEDFVYCKDEVFVNCNGQISKAIDIAECNGVMLDVPKVTGFAVFDKGWEDPRE